MMSKALNKSKLNRSFFFLLYLLCFTLPIFIPHWHGKLVILLGLVWILLLKGKGILRVFLINRLIIFIVLLVLVELLGLLYSVNTHYGFSTLESIAPLVILPVIIFSSDEIINNKVLLISLISLVAGVIILNLASLAFISQELWDPKNLQANIILANNSIVQIHPAFVSLYLSFCVFFLIDQYFPLQTTNRSKLGWILFSLFILCAYLVWINSRTGIFSFIIGFIFYSFYRFNGTPRIISLSILAVFLAIIFLVPFSRERFFNTTQLAARGMVSIESQNPNIYPLVARKQILECSVELLKGPELLYGYGTGDFRDALVECYKSKGYRSLYEKRLDSHNEYFSQLHKNGIVGLVLFIGLLIVPLRYALKYRSPLLAVFIILFGMTAFFENVFSAQKGVTFFALFCPLLMLFAKKKYESPLVE